LLGINGSILAHLPVAKPKQVRPHLLAPDSVDQPVESQHG
jgi:hypothetical protein